MKYIRTKFRGFYTFPLLITHEDFMLNNFIAKEDIAGAGYIFGGQCCSKSVSLNIAAQPNDTADLREQMGMEELK